MNFPAVDWSATFEEDCITAVESYVAEERRVRPQTLDYLGIDLGSALERHLYIELMQNRTVQYLYACALVDTDAELQELPQHLVEPARQLVPTRKNCILPASPSGSARRAIVATANRVLGMLGGSAEATPILAAVHHPKFVRYLRPVADTMPTKFAFLVVPRAASRHYDFPLKPEELRILPRATPRKTAASAAWPDLCRWTEELDTALQRYRPACVLTVEGDAPYHELIAGCARKRGIATLCLQWGAFPYRSPRNGFRRMSHDAFLSWGEGFVEQLVPYNPGLAFEVVGDHVLEPRSSPKTRRLVFLLQGVNNTTIQPWHHRDLINFAAWTAEHYPDWEMIVRPHPSLPLSPKEADTLAAYANVRIEETARVPLCDSLDGAALAVAMTSSAILEAAANGAIPFLFNPTTAVPRFRPDFEAWQAGLEVKTLADAQQRIGELLVAGDPDAPAFNRFRPGLQRLVDHFFCATGPTALKNIQSQIEQAVSRNDAITMS